MNKILITGNLTRDIELRYMPSGSALATFGIASNRQYKDKNTGEKRQEVTFIDVKIFGKSAEVANQYLSKGSKVLIEGRLVFEQWEDQQGNKRSKHVVSCETFEFLDSKKDSQSGDGDYTQNNGYVQQGQSYNHRGAEVEHYVQKSNQ